MSAETIGEALNDQPETGSSSLKTTALRISMGMAEMRVSDALLSLWSRYFVGLFWSIVGYVVVGLFCAWVFSWLFDFFNKLL